MKAPDARTKHRDLTCVRSAPARGRCARRGLARIRKRLSGSGRYTPSAMQIDDLTSLLAPIGPIVAATAWIHVSLSKIGTKLEVAISQLTDHRERIARLEEKVERIELANARSGKETSR